MLLRQDIKRLCPALPFRVRTHNYSGGSSIRISCDQNTPPEEIETVRNIASKYEAGHFDSMTDCYEFTNRNGLPHARCVFVELTH